MKQTTIDRIVRNRSDNRQPTVIGRYTYDVKPTADGYDIIRALTDDKDRMWIDHDGNYISAWQSVASVTC